MLVFAAFGAAKDVHKSTHTRVFTALGEAIVL